MLNTIKFPQAQSSRLRFFIFVFAAAAGLVLNAAFSAGLFSGDLFLFPVFWLVHASAYCISIAAGLWYMSLLAHESRESTAAVALGLFFLSAGLLSGLPPVVQKDALLYHLFVPKQWLAQGSFQPLAWHQPSYFPLLTSLAYAGFLKFDLPNFLSAFYHGGFVFLSGLLAVLFAVSIFDLPGRKAVWAFPLTTTVPICIRLAGEPMADAPVAFFFGAAMLLSLEDLRRPVPALKALAPGVFLGLALSSKYSPMLAIVLYGAAWIVLAAQQGKTMLWMLRYTALLVIALLTTAAPWLLRNYLATGDPIYPFLNEILGRSETHAFIGRVSPFQLRIQYYGEGFLEYVLLPFRLLFMGRDNSGRYFDGAATPLLLFAVLPVCLCKPGWTRRACLMLLSTVLLHVYLAPFLHRLVLRYHAPFLAAAVAGSICGLELARKQRFFRHLPAAALVFQLVFAAWYTRGFFSERDLKRYVSGAVSLREYVKMHVRDYDLIQAVDERLSLQDRVYLLYSGNALFYYQRQAAAHLDPSFALSPWLRGESPACSFAKELHLMHANFLAFHSQRMAAVLKSYCKESPAGCRRWNEFNDKCLKNKNNAGNYVLAEIDDAPAPICSCEEAQFH